MRLGTVCSGIGAPELAASRLGWHTAWGCEIEKFPRAVLAARHPGVEFMGNMLEVDWSAKRATCDVLCAGTPCQAFSVAGARGGMDDARGDLTRNFFTRVVPGVRPGWVVWENVPGVLSIDGGRVFGAVVRWLVECGYGVCWRVLDAQYFGLSQRRRRVFVVGCLDDGWQRAGAVLFDASGLRGDPAPCRETGARVAGSIDGCAETSRTFSPLDYSDGTYRADDISSPLTTTADPSRATPLVASTKRSGVRRLTPTECERLQGFPDGYTDVEYRGKKAADEPRYRALGNSMAVPVLEWIFRRIEAVSKLEQDHES